VAGYDLSSQGTTAVGGRNGIVADCVIDHNIRDGLGIGNTPGRYTFRGNHITGNGRYGYWEHNLPLGDQQPAALIVLDGNEIRDNALDGFRWPLAQQPRHRRRQVTVCGRIPYAALPDLPGQAR
jgi:hypothetical protein